MLVLTRKINQAIRISDDIEIRVVHVSGNKVRLSIQAPEEITVHREEVYERIRANWLADAETQVEPASRA